MSELVKLVTDDDLRIDGELAGPRKIVFKVPGGTMITGMEVPATEFFAKHIVPLPGNRYENFVTEGIYTLTFEGTRTLDGSVEEMTEFENFGRFRNSMDAESIGRRLDPGYGDRGQSYPLAVAAAGHQSAFTVDKLAQKIRKNLPELIEMWAHEVEDENKKKMV